MTDTPASQTPGPPTAEQIAAVTAALPRPKGWTDLFTLGEEVTVTGPGGEIKVWLAKVEGPDWDECVRMGDAARAAMQREVAREDSDEVLSALGALIAAFNGGSVFDDNTETARALAEFAAMDELKQASDEADAKLMYDEERTDDDDPSSATNRWAKDNYLLSLIERWIGKTTHLSAVFARVPVLPDEPTEEEAEAHFIWGELNAFLAEAYERREEARKLVIEETIVTTPVSELREKAVKVFLDLRATRAWTKEFSTWRAYHATRVIDMQDVRFFDVNPRRVASSDPQTGEPIIKFVSGRQAIVDGPFLEQLILAYDSLEITRAEGNGLPSDRSSSPPSELIDRVASTLSGLLAAPS